MPMTRLSMPLPKSRPWTSLHACLVIKFVGVDCAYLNRAVLRLTRYRRKCVYEDRGTLNKKPLLRLGSTVVSKLPHLPN
nr:MAG TPA: hypothetical protein [Caudoviricetes sp.]